MPQDNEVSYNLNATTDYVNDEVTARVGEQDVEMLVEWRDRVIEAKGALATAQVFIDQELAKRLESGARQIGDRVYARRKDYKRRFLHPVIRTFIRDRAKDEALDTTTGEINLDRALGTALALMDRLYLSSATTAKVTELDRLGIPRDEVINSEFTGYKLSVTELDEREPTSGTG